MNEIILNKIKVDRNRVDYYFSTNGKIKKYFNDNHLFLKFNEDISEVPQSILTIPFVANVIPLVWITNSYIKVDVLDKSFYQSLTPIKKAYQEMYPIVEFKGLLQVKEIIDHQYSPEIDAAAFFSGGLDAMTTFVRIKDKKPILITEYGFHKKDITESEVWNADRLNAINFANKHGLRNILIESNYGTFIKAENINRDYQKKLMDTWWHGLHHSLAIISAAIPISYKLRINCLYIASSKSEKTRSSCASDPAVDNEIKFATGSVFHDGFELTRQDKVKVVVDNSRLINEQIELRVCFLNTGNCCKCEKCLRTIFGIIAEGEDPNHFGFYIGKNVTEFLKNALEKEVKFLTDSFIKYYWIPTQIKMQENKEIIKYQDLLQWYLKYDHKLERKKELLRYRTTQFFPIIKRRISTNIKKIIGSS